MKKFWNWLQRYIWIPLFFVIAFLIWIIKRRKTPLAQTRVELKTIQASAQALKMEERLGSKLAAYRIGMRYQATIQELDEAQKNRVKELSNDPAKLAAFLVRAGSRD